jgi:putative restriction endonuclease
MWDSARQDRLRREAMAWLTLRTHDGALPITREDLGDFRFDGEPFALLDRQRGIRSPAGWGSALSIMTVWRREGAQRPYDDGDGPDGLIRYQWRGADVDHPENRALRAAMVSGAPLIWFYGVGPGSFEPRFPVYLLDEEVSSQQFVVDFDVARGLVKPGSAVEEHLRRYIVRETRQRLHQPVFRAQVMRAYEVRCAVCNLGHAQLLDAAHIVPDSQEGGIAAVRNGLALCKIHHSAYDHGILGIRPDLVVEVRADLLDEVDGPMLRYGLQERHGQPLMMVPRARREQPDRELLAQQFTAFLAG